MRNCGGTIMDSHIKTKGKTKTVYTKEMMIRTIAKKCGEDYDTVRDVYNTLEDDIAKKLSLANANTDVSIRLFEGVTLNSTYSPGETKLNHLTGEMITSISKIRPKAYITRSYRDKITNYNN